jgi:AcrR family transcriptional regulator
MAEVARRVGVTEPVVFQNFGSKAVVFAAVIETAALRMSATMRERATASGSVIEWLRELLGRDHLQHAHARGTVGVLFAEAQSLMADPLVAGAARRGHAMLAGTLTDLLTTAQREGDVAPDVDPETGAWWILSLLASQGFRRAALPEGERDDLEERLGAMTLRALTAVHAR